MDESIESQVKQANRDYHNNLDPGDYHENPSIFDRDRQREIRQTLQSIANPDGRLLDVGCGTGNILRWGSQFFRRVSGTDISENMLELARREVPGADYYLSDASQLPFGNNTFDAVTFYATLHHFPSPVKFLEEALRVVKPGGYIYTDHDPNYFLVRFYYPFFNVLFYGKQAFGSQAGDMAEYYHTQEPGINPVSLADSLRKAGATSVTVNYRNTRNKQLSPGKKVIMAFIRPLADWTGWKSFFTHFSIIARK